MDFDRLILKVRAALMYETPCEVCIRLVSQGVAPDEVWLLVNAAQILDREGT